VDNRAVNKKAIEALIKCGAFGSTGATRKGMLSVLEQAQGAGQKAQQDALIGQGSIFDLGFETAPGESAAGGIANGFAMPSHAPIPAIEFDRTELLAAEKDAIGLFISEHPLKEVGPALRARVDCRLSELASKRDGDLVSVGGIITQCKRIRTKKGDPMMFATLDDLDAAVEIIVFGNALAASEEALSPDSIVQIRGRVDHKDREQTCIIVQQVERFDPSPDEVRQATEQAAKLSLAPTALRLKLDATALPAAVLAELKDVLAGFPGEAEVLIELSTSVGQRRLKLGPRYRVTESAALLAELNELLGPSMLGEETQPSDEAAATAVS
jgi:DNA polymerase-3 subunit alpha